MAKQHLLTTIDNPFDPFEQFDSWLMFDNEKGYQSLSKMMRIAQITDDMTEQEQEEEIEHAIDRIIELDFRDVYKKVSKDYDPEAEKAPDN